VGPEAHDRLSRQQYLYKMATCVKAGNLYLST